MDTHFIWSSANVEHHANDHHNNKIQKPDAIWEEFDLQDNKKRKKNNEEECVFFLFFWSDCRRLNFDDSLQWVKSTRQRRASRLSTKDVSKQTLSLLPPVIPILSLTLPYSPFDMYRSRYAHTVHMRGAVFERGLFSTCTHFGCNYCDSL